MNHTPLLVTPILLGRVDNVYINLLISVHEDLECTTSHFKALFVHSFHILEARVRQTLIAEEEEEEIDAFQVIHNIIKSDSIHGMGYGMAEYATAFMLPSTDRFMMNCEVVRTSNKTCLYITIGACLWFGSNIVTDKMLHQGE